MNVDHLEFYFKMLLLYVVNLFFWNRKVEKNTNVLSVLQKNVTCTFFYNSNVILAWRKKSLKSFALYLLFKLSS